MGRDLEIDSLLENDNMEQLAALVLNGEGRRLVRRQCGNPELQAFIDNVPTYMVRYCCNNRKQKRYIYVHLFIKKIYIYYIILGKNSYCAHGSARRKSSGPTKRIRSP